MVDCGRPPDHRHRISDARLRRASPGVPCRSGRAAIRSRRRAGQRRAPGLAKQLGANPREVAAAGGRTRRRALHTVCSAVEIAGPGSSTSRSTTPSWPSRSIGLRDRRAARRAHRLPRPSTVVVDYSAPNVAKEMHVGHLRTTVIGDALARMLEFVGHDVDPREPHRRLGHARSACSSSTCSTSARTRPPRELSLGDLDGFYKEAGAKFDADAEFKDRARASGSSRCRAATPRRCASGSCSSTSRTRYFNAVYRKLGVLLDRRRPGGRERLQRAAAGGRRALDGDGSARGAATAPRSSSRPASPTARASPCR